MLLSPPRFAYSYLLFSEAVKQDFKLGLVESELRDAVNLYWGQK